MSNLEVALEELKSERVQVSGRLDAIDLAIDNLKRVISGTGRYASTLNAADRRAVLLDVLKKFPGGASLRQVRDLTPGMSGKERSNALQSLKREGVVKRKKGLWLNARVDW